MKTTLDAKMALLARGEPWIVHPREVAKSTAHYNSSPEIILGCCVVGGSLDTSIPLIADRKIQLNLPISPETRQAFDAFYRVWSEPERAEMLLVMQWATRIFSGCYPRKKMRPFVWKNESCPVVMGIK